MFNTTPDAMTAIAALRDAVQRGEEAFAVPSARAFVVVIDRDVLRLLLDAAKGPLQTIDAAMGVGGGSQMFRQEALSSGVGVSVRASAPTVEVYLSQAGRYVEVSPDAFEALKQK